MKKHYKLWVALLIILILVLSIVKYTDVLNDPKQEDKPITLIEFNKRIANKEKIVLVYFSGDWCSVCQKMKPIIDELQIEFSQKMEVLRIDTERDKEITKEFEIDTLPVILIYRNGKQEWIYVGLIEKRILKEQIKQF